MYLLIKSSGSIQFKVIVIVFKKPIVEPANLITSVPLLENYTRNLTNKKGATKGEEKRVAMKMFQVNDTSWNLLVRVAISINRHGRRNRAECTSYNRPGLFADGVRPPAHMHVHARTRTARLFNSTEWKALLSRRYACKTGGRRFVSHTSSCKRIHTHGRA